MPEETVMDYLDIYDGAFPRLEKVVEDFCKKNKLDEPERTVGNEEIMAASSKNYLLIFSTKYIGGYPPELYCPEIDSDKTTKRMYDIIGKIKDEPIELETIILHTRYFKKVLNDSAKCYNHFEYYPTGEKTIKTKRIDKNREYWFIINHSESLLIKNI